MSGTHVSESFMNEISYLDIALEKIDGSYGRLRLIQPQAETSMFKSIERFGQMTPAVVSSCGNDRYEMIDGFKRLRALRRLERDSIRARVLEGHGRVLKAAMIQLNRAGRTIRDMEEALVVVSLYREEMLNQVEIGTLLGHDKSWVSRRIALIEKLSDDVLEHLRLGLITPTHGRELTRLPRGNQKLTLDSLLKHHLTSRETRQLVDKLLKSPESEHASILWLPLDILDNRQPPRPSQKESPFEKALIRLEKSCVIVIQRVDEGAFSGVPPQMDSARKALDGTLNRLNELASF
jgi:ParB/RepB/Spo0J family partition protein